jgi:ATP-binding cassette subfamily C protein
VLLAVLLAMHWAYALLGLVCCIVLGVLTLLGDCMLRSQTRAAAVASALATASASNAMRAAEPVLAMGMLPALARRWAAEERDAAAGGGRALLRARAVLAVTRGLRLAMTGAMVALGLVLVLGGSATAGSMIAGNMIMARLLMPFEAFASTYRQWIEASASWRRVRTALAATAPVRATEPLPCTHGRLVVERLVHVLPGSDRPVLRGVSFSVEPGEILGIIGPSGAGKSTLLRLLAGMAEPTGGGAYLDGHSTFLWERSDFARHVGYVPQSVALADATVAENIAGLEKPDLAEVLRIARRVGLHEAVQAMPHGYATRVAGFALSAGQRQRLALARALYRRPKLLLLDEPSAFLDDAGEAMLVGLLRGCRAGGTSAVVVTHRPKIIAPADNLLLLSEGLVDRLGPRESVLRAVHGPAVRLVRAPPQAQAAS